MKNTRLGGKPVLLRGGPLANSVHFVEDLYPDIRFPLQNEFLDLTTVERVETTDPAWMNPSPESMKMKVAIYVRSGDETSLQLPPPAPPDARRIGYEYTYDRTETM